MHTKLFLGHSSTCSDAAAAPKVLSRKRRSLRIRLRGGANLVFHFSEPMCLVSESFVLEDLQALTMGEIRHVIATAYARGFKAGEVTRG